jgi:6-phosphofructokinase 2
MNPALDITTDADVVRLTDKIRCAGARYDLAATESTWRG